MAKADADRQTGITEARDRRAALRMIGGRPSLGWALSVSAKARRKVLPAIPRAELDAALEALRRLGPESDLAGRLVRLPSSARVVESPGGRRLDLRVDAPGLDVARNPDGVFLRDALRARLRAGEAELALVRAGPERLLLHRDAVHDPEAGVVLDLSVVPALSPDCARRLMAFALRLFGVEVWRTPRIKTWLARSDHFRRRRLSPSGDLVRRLGEAIRRRGAGPALDDWLNHEDPDRDLPRVNPTTTGAATTGKETAVGARLPATTAEGAIIHRDWTFDERLGLRELLVERRPIGAFDTPPELAEALIERSFGPTLDGPLRAEGLLARSIFDPTCGAGRLLVAAVDRLAERLRELPDAESAGVDLGDWRRALASSRAVILGRPGGVRGLDLDPLATEFTRAALRALAGAEPPVDAVTCGDVFSDAAPASDSPRRHLIGNPPWRSFYSRESARPQGEALTEAAEAWRRRPGLERRLGGRVNLYLLFLSRALELSPRGPVTLILPDSLAVNGSLAATRAWLGERFDGCHRIENPGFRANVGVCLIRFRGAEEPASEIPLATLTRARELFRPTGAGDRGTRIRRADLLRRPERRWIPDSPDAVIELGAGASVLLGELAEIRDGINPGPAEWRRRLIVPDRDDGTPGDEDPSLRPCLEGRRIHPYAIAPARLRVRCDPDLIPVEARRRGTSLRRPEIFDRPGILTRQTAPRIIAAVEDQGRRFLNSAHKILPTLDDPAHRHRLCAFLNSDWLSATYRHMSGETRRVFPQVHIAMLRRLPVPRELATGESARARRLAELGAEAARIALAALREPPGRDTEAAALAAIQAEIEDLVIAVVRAGRPR